MSTFKRKIRSPLTWLLVVSFLISFGSLAVYLIGIGFPDEILFFLLAILRYSSFMVFVCTLYRLLYCLFRIFITHFIEKTRLKLSMFIRYSILIFIYIIFISYCAGIFYLEAFVTVFSEGTS